MPGTFGYPYQTPQRIGGTYQQPALYSPTATAPSTSPMQVPAPPTNYALPAPPSIPNLPSPDNTYLPQLQSILEMFRTFNAFPGLPPDVLAMLSKMSESERLTAERTFADAMDQAIARLYGQGVERSTIATDATGRLADQQAATMAAIEAQAAQRQLGLQQYAGQQELASLGAQAGIVGQGATLEQNAYNALVNSILQRAGLENQQYAAQTGNVLNQQQLAQQYQTQLQQQQLAQQQFLQQLLTGFLSGQYNLNNLQTGATGFGTSGGGGVGGSFGFGYNAPTRYGGTNTPTGYPDMYSIYQMLMRLFQGQPYAGG